MFFLQSQLLFQLDSETYPGFDHPVSSFLASYVSPSYTESEMDGPAAAVQVEEAVEATTVSNHLVATETYVLKLARPKKITSD